MLLCVIYQKDRAHQTPKIRESWPPSLMQGKRVYALRSGCRVARVRLKPMSP